MKRSLVTAAILSATLFAGMANAAQTEMQMVEDTAKRLLIELNLPSDTIDNLTVAQMREIIAIADSKEMGDATRARVQKIIGEN